MLALLLMACTSSTTTQDCAALELPDRDYCWSDRIESFGPGEIDAVREASAAISDPLVREASVLAWLGVHADSVPLKEAEALCAEAGGQDSWICQRRIHAAHLRRSKAP